MRLISFALTKQQFIDGTKDVTRRLYWQKLKAGDHLMVVEKTMGLKKGEKVVKLGEIEVINVRREPLLTITQEDVVREGFPDWDEQQFIDFFCQVNKFDSRDDVTRIEFRKVM